MISRNVTALVFAILCCLNLHAQVVRSDVLDTTVHLQVHASESAEGQAYIPLVYLGEDEQISLVASLANHLSKSENFPPLLVVGISDFTNSDWEERLSNYTNYGADPLQEFLTKELIGYLEQHFNIQPYRLLAGQGQAAAYVFTVMMDQQNVYNAYFCMAPTFYHLPHPELAMRTFLVDHFHWDDFLYIAQGFGDDTQMKESLELSRLLNSHSVERPIDYHYKFFDQVKNSELLPIALPDALRKLFADLDLTIMLNYGGAEYLWDKQTALVSKYGYDPLQLKLPKIPVSRKLLPTGRTQPALLPAQFKLLWYQEQKRYSFDKTELLNLKQYFQANELPEAVGYLEDILEDEQYNYQHQNTNALNHYGQSTGLEQGKLLTILDGSDTENQLHIEGAQLRNEKVGSIQFDGKDDYAIIQSDRVNNLTKSFSLSLWINPASSARFEAFISQAVEGEVKSHWRVGFGPMPETQWGLSIWNNAWKDYLINQSIPYHTWTHLAIVVDQSLGWVTYYMNGEPVGKVEQVFPLFPTQEPIIIGRNNQVGGYFDGQLSNVSLYERGLSAAEVRALFEQNQAEFE